MEVKGDFCQQVRSMLQNAGRADDYVEIGLDTGVCYNPLHNDLDPYAVAYAIATLLNNLFGKSKEPFWQQAYTDLLKFVILLRRLTDGYTTFAEVYRYILDDSADRPRHQAAPRGALAEPPEVLLVPMEEYRVCRRAAGLVHIGSRKTPTTWRIPYDAELETYLAAQGVPYEVRKAQGSGWAARRHQLEALERWYASGWSRLDAAALVHHRGRRRVPLAVRRQPRGAPRVLSAA